MKKFVITFVFILSVVGQIGSAQIRGIYNLNDSTKYRARFDEGQDSSAIGYSLATGDINGDGIQDVVIAKYRGITVASSVYVVYGSSILKGVKNLADTSNFDVRFDKFFEHVESGLEASINKPVACGDINGDGFDDIIIGSNGSSPNGQVRAGSVYVIYGSHNLHGIKNLDSTSSYNVRFDGKNPDDNLGERVATGDINGDGKSDVVMAQRALNIYIVYGDSSLSGIKKISDSSSYNVHFYYSYTPGGLALGAVGDINKDGKADFLLQKRGYGNKIDTVYLFYGKTFPKENDLWMRRDDIVARIIGDGSLGLGRVAIGDVNGDGESDVVLGAPQQGHKNQNGTDYVGSVFVVSGSKITGGAGQTLFDMTNPTDYLMRIDGQSRNSGIGIGIFGLGVWDVNGDGIKDIVIGAPFNEAMTNFSGTVYIVYGNAMLQGVKDLMKQGDYQARIDGVNNGTGIDGAIGAGIAGADIDKDGMTDLFIGAPGERHNTNQSNDYPPQGSVYYINAKDTGTTINVRDEHPPIAQVELAQAYPNPLTNEGRVFLNYSLSTATPVSVKICDTFGRKILEDKSELQTEGVHDFSFDASSLKAGVYFYTIDTHSGAKSGKFVVVK